MTAQYKWTWELVLPETENVAPGEKYIEATVKAKYYELTVSVESEGDVVASGKTKIFPYWNQANPPEFYPPDPTVKDSDGKTWQFVSRNIYDTEQGSPYAFMSWKFRRKISVVPQIGG